MNFLRTVPRTVLAPACALALAAPALAHCNQPTSSAAVTTLATSTNAPAQAAAVAPSAAPAAPSQIEVRSPARNAFVLDNEPAPRFRAVAHDGRVIEVTDAPRARPLVVYFYPRDETPGCTIEAQQFRDTGSDLDRLNADVVGVSTDDNAAHTAFAQHHNLRHALIADTDSRLAGAFGVPTTGGGARRVTFVIGTDNRVMHTFRQVMPEHHAAEVVSVLRGERPER